MTAKQTIVMHILLNISQSKDNQTMEFVNMKSGKTARDNNNKTRQRG